MAPYFLGYQAPVPASRINSFLHDELDSNEIALLFQDIIEIGAIPQLSGQVHERFYDHACYYVSLGWCSLNEPGKVH